MTDHPRVTFTIEPYTFQTWHRGRRGSPRTGPGTKVYAIRYSSGGYFTYSYLDELDAKEVIIQMEKAGTNTEQYRPFNYAASPEATLHVMDAAYKDKPVTKLPRGPQQGRKLVADREWNHIFIWLRTLSDETLGSLFREYLEESAHSNWEGYSSSDKLGIRSMLIDMNLYLTAKESK